jgi:hypothetical protein
MSITAYLLDDFDADPETKRVLAVALEKTRVSLGLTEPQPTGRQRSVYAVDGVPLGATVRSKSSAYREYKCRPSDQFDGFTWYQKTRKGKERRGSFTAIYSILHSPDGAAVYINRYQEPAFFGESEVDDDIQRYSRKIGEATRITRLPSAPSRCSGWHTRFLGQS